LKELDASARLSVVALGLRYSKAISEIPKWPTFSCTAEVVIRIYTQYTQNIII